MLSALWARITGKDKGLRFPDQQAVALGRAGDYTVIFPYGHSCNLPDDALLLEIAPGIAIPVTVSRPTDAARGEVALFHPVTNSRMIFKNDGNIDVKAPGSVVNVEAETVNMTGDLNVAGDLTVTGSTTLGSTVTSNGKDISDTHTHSGSPTAPSGPVSDTGTPV